MTADERKELDAMDTPGRPPPLAVRGVGPAHPIGVEFDGARWVLLVEGRDGVRKVPLAVEGAA